MPQATSSTAIYGIFQISGPEYSGLDVDAMTEEFIQSANDALKADGTYIGQATLENKVLRFNYDLSNINACRMVGYSIHSTDWSACESKTYYFDVDQNYHGGFVKVCKIHQR